MDRAAWSFALNLGWFVFWAGFTIDYYLFDFDRTVKRMMDKCKSNGSCLLCGRQMQIIPDSTAEYKK